MSIFSPPHPLDSARWQGRRVGLLGGSFNPPHEGHVHISMAAMNGLKLDAVWWLVTPQNPLKTENPLPLQQRMDMCRKLVSHPRILISDIEAQLGTNITYDTIKALKPLFPSTKFVWISGMDNANTLHTWNNWQDLLQEICMLHLSRTPATSLIRKTPYRMLENQTHVFIDKAARWSLDSGVTYWMMQKKMVNISSTEIRKRMSKNNILNNDAKVA